jgi:hypothetical protein
MNAPVRRVISFEKGRICAVKALKSSALFSQASDRLELLKEFEEFCAGGTP